MIDYIFDSGMLGQAVPKIRVSLNYSTNFKKVIWPFMPLELGIRLLITNEAIPFCTKFPSEVSLTMLSNI